MTKTLVLALAAALAATGAFAAKPAPAKKKAKPKKAAKDAPRVTSLHDKFLALDVNADGVIDAGEIYAYEKKVMAVKDKDGKKMDPKDADAAQAALDAEFKRDDASGDGKVTEAEFKAAESSGTAKP